MMVPWFHNPHPKEWVHLLVIAQGVALLINISRIRSTDGDRWQLVLGVSDGKVWEGSAARLESLQLMPDGLGCEFGSIRRAHDAIHIDLHSALFSLKGMFLHPAEPLVSKARLNNAESLGWSTHPAWLCNATLDHAGRSREIVNGWGYQDHNWGKFRFDGDFSWDWLVMHERGTTAILTRMHDRARRVTSFQELHVWCDGRLDKIACGDEITVQNEGFQRSQLTHVPGLLRHTGCCSPTSVPERMNIASRIGYSKRIEVGPGMQIWAPESGSENFSVFSEHTCRSTSGTCGVLELHGNA